jgi:uncharacterized protein
MGWYVVRRPDDPEGRAGRLVVSASDLAWFSRCAHRSTMDRAVLEGAEFERSPTDPFVQILIDAGIAHEVAYLEHLRATLGPDAVVDCSAGDLGTQVAATRDALERGVPVVFQAALLTPDPEVADVWWQGHIDFAVRAPDGTYEPHDTKLGANPKAPWAVQLAVYGAQLGFVCGTTPQRGVVVSPGGDGFTATEVNLDAVDLNGLRRGLVYALTADPAPSTLPDRKGACSQCLWTNICDDERRRQGSLTLVRDIRANQVAALREVGIATIDELADCHPDGVPALTGVSDAVAAKLARQAAAQMATLRTGQVFVDVIDRGAKGLGALPPPAKGDTFFDIEGTHLVPGGLEYLFGVGWEKGLRHRFAFEAIWATDTGLERQAFDDLVRLLTKRLGSSPGAHLYHFNFYERTALLRLAARHGIHQRVVDEVIVPAMVDLLPIVRNGLVVGTERYGLKQLEPLFRGKRDGDVTDAVASLVEFDRFRATGDRRILAALEAYNRDDVESTWLLHRWLLSLRNDA